MARSTQNFNDGWFFTKEQVDPTRPPFGQMEQVNLPHTWNALDGQDGGDDYHRGTCWYAKKFAKPQGESVWLEFGAVSQTAEVFINGTQAARHEAGFSIFRVDMTPYLAEGENLVVVSADNGVNETTYPQFADFTFYGGIYRDVSLITVPKQHFDLDWHGAPGIAVTPVLGEGGAGSPATVKVRAWAKNAAGLVCRAAIIGGAEVELAPGADGLFEGELTVENPHLWQAATDPYLYTATARLLAADGTVLDEVSTKFGFRTYSVDPDKGFMLNGVPTPLHGVSRHQCRENKGWAISREDERQDITLIAEMGANSIRLAHYQHSQSFYDLCDEFGMVVWAEIPLISSFMDNPAARANTMLQMTELIAQSINHPSICFWGISNEITIGGDDDPALLENQRALNELCHQMDPTRLTTLADLSMVEVDSPQNDLTDVLAYNHYFGWYGGDVKDNGPWFDDFHKRQPSRAVGLSEYGAEGNIALHSETPEVRDYSEEYQCVYHEGMLETFATRPWLWGTYVWNMFEFGSDMRDEGMVKGRNNKGLVNFSRTVKKDAYFLYKAYWTEAPFAHLCGRRFVDRCGDKTNIKVYAAGADEIALVINGAEAARKTGRHVFAFEAALAMGANTVCAVGYAAGAEVCRDEISLNRVETPNQTYRMPEEDAAGEGAEGATNWFDPAYSGQKLTFKEGYLSVKDRFADVMQNPEGEALVTGMMQTMMQSMGGGKKGGMKISKGMMKMLGQMTFENIAKMAGKKMPPGTLEMINAKLQEIKKEG